LKLIISVVNDKDAGSLLATLVKEGYRATKLSSTGGFLREGNTTFFMGVEDEQVEPVVLKIREICHARQQVVSPLPSLAGMAEAYVSYPLEVTVGGAMIFILDIEETIRV